MTTVNSTATPVSGTQRTTPTLLRFDTIEAALRALLVEVTPGIHPYSSDSYLPDHLIEAAQAALYGIDVEVKQRAHNALSMASWHVARGEPDKALARLRRAQAHIRHGMTTGGGLSHGPAPVA